MSLFTSRTEMWAFAALLCLLGFVLALMLTGCQMPLR
jgi:4-hydroxybenzoate polyprenyltransferase